MSLVSEIGINVKVRLKRGVAKEVVISSPHKNSDTIKIAGQECYVIGLETVLERAVKQYLDWPRSSQTEGEES